MSPAQTETNQPTELSQLTTVKQIKWQSLAIMIGACIILFLVIDIYQFVKKQREEKYRVISIQVENCIKQAGFPYVDWENYNTVCSK